MLTIKPEHLKVAEAIDAYMAAQERGPLSRFQYVVQIIHQEGTILLMNNCYLAEHEDIIYVFGEHHPLMIFYKDDLHDWGMFKQVRHQHFRGTEVQPFDPLVEEEQ